jgi:hypothetical protein
VTLADATEYRLMLRKNDVTAASIAIISIMFSLIANDVYFENGNESNPSITMIRVLVMVLTLTIMLLVVRHYKIKVNYLIQQERLDKSTWLIDAVPYNRHMAIELLVLAIISPPGYDKTYEMD